MAVTQNTYTGDGTTVLFSFTFPYLETTDIKVSVNGSTTTAYTLANATTIQFNTAPANGAAIRIYRQTDDSALAATFYPGSAIRSSDLNENFTQNLYVTQESSNNATTATTTANTALTNSNTAISTANTALSTANTASTNASAAVNTANTASSNASAAVSTANTANTNASAAVATANTASTNASAAVSTANTASTNASQALTTANSAVSTANSAVTTANTAASNASTAISTANTALSTANSASSTASSAVTTANTANTNATAALNAVANSLQYVLVANVAAIPSSPANNYAIELADSTGVESFSPLANRPAGFVGDPGLSVRMQYSTTGPTWNWLNYFPNNAETRYLKLAGGTLTGQLKADDSTSVAAPVIAFDGDTNTGIAHTGADELALVTGGTARVTIDSSGSVAVTNALSVGGQAAVVTNDSRLSDARTPTDGSVTDAKVAANAAIAGSKIQAASTTNAGVVQLTDSTSSTSTTTAATPNAVKSAYDLANAALPKAGGALTGDVTLNAQSDLRFADADSSNWVALQGPATVSSNVTWTLPSADGTSGQVLSTNGSGTLSWATAAAGGASVTTSDTPPATPNDGDLWYDSVGGRTYVYYQDPNGSQWVDASPQGGGGSGTSITTGNTTAEVIDTGSDGRFVVTTEGTEALRVDSSRRLLVGTNTSLSLDGFGSNLQLEATTFAASQSIVRHGGPAAIRLGRSGGNAIGSTTVVANGNELGALRFIGADGSDFDSIAGQITCEVDGTPGANDMPGRLIFATTADGAASPTERFRINSSGQFFLNTTSSSGFVTDGGKFYLRNSGECMAIYNDTGSGWNMRHNATSNAGTFYFISFAAAGTGVGGITSNSTTTTYGTTSDYRLKENVEQIANAVDRLKQLNPCKFNFIAAPERTVDGFLAHEVQAHVPEAVVGEKDAVDENGEPIYQNIDQSKLVPLLTAALQEAVARIEAQDTTIASLEARLTALEGGN